MHTYGLSYTINYNMNHISEHLTVKCEKFSEEVLRNNARGRKD